MDVTYTNVLESTRQYFQGVPTPGGSNQNPGFPHTNDETLHKRFVTQSQVKQWAREGRNGWLEGTSQYFPTVPTPGGPNQNPAYPHSNDGSVRKRFVTPPSATASQVKQLVSEGRNGWLNDVQCNGNIPTLPSMKTSQSKFEGSAVPPRPTSPSGYAGYFQPQQQQITNEHHQNHQQNHLHQQLLQQQQLQHQHLQQQQQHLQQQQQLHHHQQQQEHHHQQLLQQQLQHHKQPQSKIIQNQQSVLNSQSLQHPIHNPKPTVQNPISNLPRQQSSQSQQVILNHSGSQHQQGQSLSQQQPHYQNHEGHQQHHVQQSLHMMQNQNKLLHGQKPQVFQEHSHQSSLHSLHNMQSSQSQTHQATHFQSQQHQNHPLLTKYPTYNIKSQQQPILQNHLQGSQQQHTPNHVQNHISNLARQSTLMSPPQQQGLTRQSPHVSHHQPGHTTSSPRVSNQSPQLFNHQQPITRHSPLISSHHQGLTRQSPHLSTHLPASVSPQVSSHPQVLTRQSPHLSTHLPASVSPQVPSHPQVLTRQSPHLSNHHPPSISPQIPPHSQSLTRQSPHISNHSSLPNSSPHLTSHIVHTQHTSSQHPSYQQQTHFSPSTPVSAGAGSSTSQTAGICNSTSLLLPVKRESPLDLSVKTIRQSADSTADSSTPSENVYYTFHNDYLRSKPSGSGYIQPVSAPKVEFPSFTSSLTQEKKRKDSYCPLPPVNCFNKSLEKLYSQQRHQQQMQQTQQQYQQQQQQQRLSLPIDPRYSHNYQKRTLEPEKLSTSQPLSKIPKLELDEWKISMDKMIEKKLAGDERHANWQEKVNGDKKGSFPVPSADKREVLSILRSSLETKESKNQQSQLQHKVTTPRYIESRLPAGAVVRQNLPSFGSLTSGTSGLIPGRLHFPRAVDSIHQPEMPPRVDIVDITDDDDVPPTVSIPNQNKGDLDGLAAFLASRIRTKAELKQQLTPNSKESPRTSISSASSNQTSPRSTPSFISPHDNKDLVRNLTSPDGPSAIVSKLPAWSTLNSFKLHKESLLQTSTPRRRSEGLPTTSAGTADDDEGAARPTETSVFDFRDSDSEAGDPLLPIVELRRSRPQHSSNAGSSHQILTNNGSTSQITTTPLPVPTFTPEEEEEFKKWLETCDELVQQLQQGRCNIRKKNRKRIEDMVKKEDMEIDDQVQMQENDIISELVKIKEEPLSDVEESLTTSEEPMKLRVRQQSSQKLLGKQKERKKTNKPGRRKKVVERQRQKWEEENLRIMRDREHWPKAPSSLPDIDRRIESPVVEVVEETLRKDPPTFQSLNKEKSFLDRLMEHYSDRRKKKKIGTEKEIKSWEKTINLKLDAKKETVAGFRDDLPAEGDLPPVIRPRGRLELRTDPTRKQTVRGSSAPPPGSTWESMRRRTRGLSTYEVRTMKQKSHANKNKTKLKFKPFRRKLKSSGFDYLRKKKKSVPRKDGTEQPREKKKKTAPLTELEIQAEMKNWVLNKGLGETVLHRAARLGSVDVVRYCLEKLHHNPAPRDNAGYTPLHEACTRGHLQVAALLLKFGANVSDSALGGVRALHEAAENGFTKIINLLLDHGADPELATYSGIKALSLASDDEARRLMETHISNHKSFQAGASFSLIGDEEMSPCISGQKMTENQAEPVHERTCDVDGFEVEESEMPLPNLYRLSSEPRTDSWVLFHELAPLLRVKTREALLKQLGQEAKTVLRDMKLSEFYAKAHCRAIKGAQNQGPKSGKVTLVKYTDTVKFLLGVEVSIIPR